MMLVKVNVLETMNFLVVSIKHTSEIHMNLVH